MLGILVLPFGNKPTDDVYIHSDKPILSPNCHDLRTLLFGDQSAGVRATDSPTQSTQWTLSTLPCNRRADSIDSPHRLTACRSALQSPLRNRRNHAGRRYGHRPAMASPRFFNRPRQILRLGEVSSCHGQCRSVLERGTPDSRLGHQPRRALRLRRDACAGRRADRAGAGAPRSKPSVLRSSSRSGQ